MIINMTGGGSGGAALNFKVVPGLTQPGTASENTIWVKTEQIGAWYFSPTQPEGMKEWDVWFPTYTSSSVEFNALKKNGIQVYPISAKQYVGSAWVDVTAKSYQNGGWVDWFMVLFDNGDQSEAVTGGWYQNKSANLFSKAHSGSASIGDVLSVNANTDNCSIISTKKKINFAGFNRLTYKVASYNSTQKGVHLIVHTKTSGDIATDYIALGWTTETGEFEVDVSSFSGEAYVSIGTYNGRYANVSRIILWGR